MVYELTLVPPIRLLQAASLLGSESARGCHSIQLGQGALWPFHAQGCSLELRRRWEARPAPLPFPPTDGPGAESSKWLRSPHVTPTAILPLPEVASPALRGSLPVHTEFL